MACGVIDRAIQAYGAEGVSQDTPLAAMYAGLRTLRIADVSRPPPFLFVCQGVDSLPFPCSGPGRCAHPADWTAGVEACDGSHEASC